MNIRNRVALLSAVAMASAVGFAAPASAQATRTWVSGVGDDVNPCSRTAPCKTFAGAISKTANGGEINCLDPGGFGAVTINKSLTIDCHYTEGGALAGGNGIVVNATASDVVYLRGLDIFGVNPPSNGVRFLVGAALHIEDTNIRRFNAANSLGVSFAPTVAAQLYMSNVTVAENGNGASGGGIEIKPGVGGSAQASLVNVRSRHNANNGVRVDTTNGQVSLTLEDSDVSGNAQGLSVQGGASNAGVMVNDTNFTANSAVGIVAAGATVTIRVDDSNITANAVGIANAGAQILSYGGNRLDGNPNTGAANNGAFTGAIILRK